MVDGDINSQVAIIIAIFSAFGVIGALIFNGIQHIKDRKNQYYKIINDFDKEIGIILENASAEVQFCANSKKTKFMTFTKEVQEEAQLFHWHVIKFCEKVAHLALNNMIPIEVARYFVKSFEKALYFIEISPGGNQYRKDVNFLIEWCTKENIKANSR